MNADPCPASPPLSIIIPCHNRADLLRDCLATVTRYAPANTQIIVIDDASPNEAASSMAREFAGVEAIRSPKRGGFCIAVNRGIAAARAPVVELLNDDTEVEPGWADAALECFRDPNVVAVAPLVLKRDGQPGVRIDSAGDTYHLGGFARKRGHNRSLSEFAPAPGEVFGASASSAFYRHDSLLRVGAFPESFGSYFEDVDVSWRLRRAGGRIVFEPRSRVWHHVGASHGVPDARLAEQQSRNEERVFWRNVPARQMWHAVPLHVAALLVKGYLRLRERRLLPFVKGRLRAWSEIRSVVSHRRGIARLEATCRQNPCTSG